MELRVDARGVGVAPGSTGSALLALGGRAWSLPPGRYRLTLRARFDGGAGVGEDRWIGLLEPPALDFSVAEHTVSG